MSVVNKPPGKDRPKLDKIGNTEAVCPYCEHRLPKMPFRKSNCPNCESYFYVRTRPLDRKKVLIRENQISLLEEQWAIYNGTYDELMAKRQAFEAEKTHLAERFNREPSDSDVYWSLFNKELLEHASNNNWGLYRNTKLRMADLLRSEGKPKDALATYLEVCYIDLNGPRNRGGIHNLDILREFPPFSPDIAPLAPAIIRVSKKLMKQLGLRLSQLKEIFISRASLHHKNLRLPVTPEDAWSNIEPELSE